MKNWKMENIVLEELNAFPRTSRDGGCESLLFAGGPYQHDPIKYVGRKNSETSLQWSASLPV